MSLINEALKKAQKQRTGEAPPLASMPAIGGESAARIARRAKPAPLNTLLVRLGLGAGALLVVLGGGALLLRDQPAPASAPAGQPAAPAPVASARPAAPAPAKPAEPVFVLPIAPAPAPAQTTTARSETTPASPRPAPPAPAVEKSGPEPARAAPPGKLESRAISYIEGIRVAGIRASSTDSKVLMNDRVYRIGDTVEHEMGLTLVGITSSSLTFEDGRGGRYTRNF